MREVIRNVFVVEEYESSLYQWIINIEWVFCVSKNQKIQNLLKRQTFENLSLFSMEFLFVNILFVNIHWKLPFSSHLNNRYLYWMVIATWIHKRDILLQRNVCNDRHAQLKWTIELCLQCYYCSIYASLETSKIVYDNKSTMGVFRAWYVNCRH